MGSMATECFPDAVAVVSIAESLFRVVKSSEGQTAEAS
jgi:hypothetical protein